MVIFDCPDYLIQIASFLTIKQSHSLTLTCKSVYTLLFENDDFWESTCKSLFKLKTLPDGANTWKLAIQTCRKGQLIPGINFKGDPSWTENPNYYIPLLSNPVFKCDSFTTLHLLKICPLKLALFELVPEYLTHDGSRYFVYVICSKFATTWETEISAGPLNDIGKRRYTMTGGMREYDFVVNASALKLGPFSDRDMDVKIINNDYEWKKDYTFICVVCVSEHMTEGFEKQFKKDRGHENIMHLKDKFHL